MDKLIQVRCSRKTFLKYAYVDSQNLGSKAILSIVHSLCVHTMKSHHCAPVIAIAP